MNSKKVTYRYITVTSGMSGFFAVLLNRYEDGFEEPQQTGTGRYEDPADAWREARSWAQSDLYDFLDEDGDTHRPIYDVRLPVEDYTKIRAAMGNGFVCIGFIEPKLLDKVKVVATDCEPMRMHLTEVVKVDNHWRCKVESGWPLSVEGEPKGPGVEVQRLRALLVKIGVCPDCGQEFDHYIAEPFASCGCGIGEWTGDLPQLSALRAIAQIFKTLDPSDKTTLETQLAQGKEIMLASGLIAPNDSSGKPD